MSSEINYLIEFGNFRLDPRRRVLWFGNRQIQMPLKGLEVLCVLVEGRGDLVTKEDLLEKVWAESFVEESNLSRQIYLLRKTFNELGMEGLIETVPRRGYRFTAEVRDVYHGNDAVTVERLTQSRTLIEIEEVADPADGKTEPGRPVSAWLLQSRSHRLVVALALLLVVTLLIGAVTYSAYRNGPGTSVAPIKSVAVLPFRTINANAENSDESLGLADILITRLSNIKEINIRPLGAVSGFDQTDAAAFGRDLKADAVLEGSIYRTADKVRITARLVKTIDGSVVWTGEFERLLQDEIKLQNEIALQVASALSANLSGTEKAAISKPYTASLTASSLYQKGRIAWSKLTREGMIEAERLFRNAVEEDPNFALAYVGLADTMGLTFTRRQEVLDAIQRALELDPNLGEAYASLGFSHMFFKWEWRLAEEAFQKSISLNPNYGTAHHWYAQLLTVQGRHEEAKSEMRRALEINPLSHNYLADLGQILYFNGEYSEAELYCRKALAIYPDFTFARFYLYQIFLKTGDYERAVDELLTGERAALVTANASAARQKEIDRSIEEQRSVFREGGIRKYVEHRTPATQDADSCYHIAQNYAFLGETEKALGCLERSYSARTFLITYIKAEPAFDNLRSEPRYQAILRGMGLAD